ncbi:hypothetical protein Tco_1082568 [Tanacetum coccineum]|uniref:Uncharacterized protein n=1 Tax=Tanacetum coccineum TaxID=301880 RepID=A0ABQ5I0T2_9ASTR
MIELRVDVELKDTIVVVVLKLNLKNPRQALEGVQVGPKVGFKPTKQVYQPVSKKNSTITSDSDSKVEKVFNETAGFTASTSSKVDNYPKSGSGVKNKSMYEQWKETYVEDPNDDDDFDDYGLTGTALQFAIAFDINRSTSVAFVGLISLVSYYFRSFVSEFNEGIRGCVWDDEEWKKAEKIVFFVFSS